MPLHANDAEAKLFYQRLSKDKRCFFMNSNFKTGQRIVVQQTEAA